MMLLCLMSLAVNAATSTDQARENPIRRIVNLLQKMAEDIEKEADQDEEMSEKYICYCQTNQKKLADGVAELQAKIPQIEASIKEAVGGADQLAQDLVRHKEERAAAKDAIATATAEREKEAESFAAESTEDKANIAACTKAVDAISAGMSGAFLQSSAATALRNLALNAKSLDRYQRGVLTDFLSASTGYAPGSGEIVGILKQLLENMQGDLKDIIDAENAAIAEFEGLVSAKEKEIQAATEAIESKTERKGESAVKIVNLKNDLEDAQDALGEDGKFLAELQKGCATAGKEYDERKALRAQELVAVQETVKILNDDDALDLFKKTMPSPTLLQTTRSADIRDEALSQLQGIQKKDPQLGMIQLALLGKKVGFEKVIKMIDDMVVLLGEEQKDDENQLKWCENEFDVSEDKEKELKRNIEQLDAKIAETKDAIATLTEEIAALQQGIKDLDKSVAEATEQRKAEHAEFVQTSAMNNAAVQLLGVAKNRLNKFYNPALYVAPKRRELTEEERIYVASGGADPRDEEEAQAKQNTIGGTGITVLASVRSATNAAPPPPPATGEFKKKDSSGPLALIDKLKADLEKDMQANEFDEKDAQETYEEFMADSAAKRATDSKTITEKDSQKAGLEGDLQAAKDGHKAASGELLALGEYIAQLHGSCDFLLENFDVRKEARSSEINAMKKAKAVLSGADYSFVQTAAFLRRH